MPEQGKDPLLAVGKIMTIVVMAVIGIATIFIVGTIPVLLLNQGDFAAAAIESGSQSVENSLIASIILLLLAATVAATAFYFFRLLGQIIDTVREHDPFTTENADRLKLMGWIALGFQLASFPIAALVAYLHDLVPMEGLSVDFDFSLTGVLLAIVLFILARIFRKGTEMREDLEGTV